jgi:hypothetical protein
LTASAAAREFKKGRKSMIKKKKKRLKVSILRMIDE